MKRTEMCKDICNKLGKNCYVWVPNVQTSNLKQFISVTEENISLLVDPPLNSKMSEFSMFSKFNLLAELLSKTLNNTVTSFPQSLTIENRMKALYSKMKTNLSRKHYYTHLQSSRNVHLFKQFARLAYCCCSSAWLRISGKF